MNHKYWIILAGIIVVALLVFGKNFLLHRNNNEASASSVTAQFTTQADWNAGTLSNIDSTSVSGQIKIDNKGSSALDLTGKTITADYDSDNKTNLIDGNTATRWGSNQATPTTYYWQIDLASATTISQINVYTHASDWWYKVQYSSNGTDFSDYFGLVNISGLEAWDNHSGNIEARYIKIICSKNITGDGAPPGVFLGEINIFSAGDATHTTGSTQIDGGANLWSWDSNTITQTVPTNTAIVYRYRSSTDGATWTPWVGSIGSVTSRTGDDSANPTRYRYLQVEATLSNTDGASTPTIDQYDIGYHTEVKPSAPTAQTAVVQ